MKFIRIGTNVTETESSEPYIQRAKKYGMFVCANYMKSYAITPKEFAKKAIFTKKYGADAIYIVDSAGSMLPEDVGLFIDELRERVELAIGYHGHNNLGLAVSNTLHCIRKGVSLIDVSLQGLGRSSGNAPTEIIALILERVGVSHNIRILDILDAGFEVIKPLVSQIGLNPIDLVCGFAGFHSSYLPLIKQLSSKFRVDPRELIIEVCKINQVDATNEIVEQAASRLESKHDDLFLSKYHFERYFVNEQR